MIPNTGGLAKKTNYNTNITEIENKIPSFTELVTSAALNIKPEVENKMPDITNPAAKATLNTKAAEVKSKIPDITNLANKVALNTRPQN